MSKFGSDLFAKEIHADKIYWKEFDPPLSEDPGGGTPPVPTLAAVLGAGSDANDIAITNLGDMTGTGDVTTSGSITSTKLDSAGPGIVCNKLQSDSIVPSVSGTGTIKTFQEIEANKVSANDTLDARAAYTYLGRIEHFTTEPTPRTAAVLYNGQLSCKSVTVSDPYNDAVPQTVISEIGGQGVVATTGLVQAAVGVTTGTVTAGTQITFGNGTATLDGFSPTQRTVCTNLDLTSSTNTFADETERYEWMSVWTDAKTNFPAPTGWRPYDPPQIPQLNFVVFDFDQDRNPGWRYFAPQSDSDCQVDPDDKMGLNEGEYVNAPNNGTAWKYAFYGTTAATTVPSHASQIVEFQFPVTQYGYGRIYMGLAVQTSPYTDAPVILNETFRLVMEHEGNALASNPRLNGPITMRWYVPDTFPTNGTQWRVYPMVRTDDTETTEGRMMIKIGNGQPLDGCNPGDPPTFDPVNTDSQQGQLLLRGYPVPSEFLAFPNPPGFVP